MDTEEMSWAKFFTSFFQLVPWMKNIRFIMGAGLIIGAIILSTNIWDKFFPPKPSVINVAGDYVPEQRDTAGVQCSLWRAYLRMGVKQK